MAITAGATPVAGVWIEAYVLRKFVDMLKDELVFSTYSEPATIRGNQGAYVARWLIPTSHKGSTTVVTEASAGTVGEITGVTISNAEQTVATYGEWFKLGQIAKESQIPGVLATYIEQMTYAGSAAIDTLLYAQAKTSTKHLHSGDKPVDGATLGATDYATTQDFWAIANYFHTTNAKGFSQLMGDYVWIMHPNQEVDLVTEVTTGSKVTWSETVKHVPGGFDQLIKTHRFVGRLGGVTAVRTNQIVTITEDVTAHHSIALAKWGLGTAGLGESGPSVPEIKHKTPGPNDTSQPLDLYDTLAWKVLLAEKLLDVNRCLVVYSAED
jgi:N4-gp56 family major capsid protein